MTKIDKLVVLDTCIDGDRNKLDELLDCRYDHLMMFYKVCKNIPPENISNIHYQIGESNAALFDIESPTSISKYLPKSNNNIIITHTDNGCRINITLNQ